MKRKHNIQGFTLIEILIALFIFSILGVMAAIALQNIIRVHRLVKATDVHLQKLEVVITLLQRDLSQIIDRPIIDSSGNKIPPVSADGGSEFSLTRTGLMNPLWQSRRSNMQRVAYAQVGHDLVRFTWNALDQPPDAKPAKKILLQGVVSLSWAFIDNQGQATSQWPLSRGSNIQAQNISSPLPKAVEMTLVLKKQGEIKMVFPVMARGIDATSTVKQ